MSSIDKIIYHVNFGLNFNYNYTYSYNYNLSKLTSFCTLFMLDDCLVSGDSKL